MQLGEHGRPTIERFTATVDDPTEPVRGDRDRERRPRELDHIVADADAIEQVVINLITNAMKFSEDEQWIEVGVRANGRTAELWVSDRGMGIAPEDTIARHAVEAHGGSIDVSSTPGSGSTFTIRLPLT